MADDVKPIQSVTAESPDGRNINYGADHKGLLLLGDWIGEHAVFWSDRLDNLRILLEEI